MVFVAVLCVATLTSPALALGRLRSNVDMQPEKVAAVLASVQNEWLGQAHVFARCEQKKDNLPVCKEAPEAFRRSCVKVPSAIVVASGGSGKDSAEYMQYVCSQKRLSPWHQDKCGVFSAAISGKMSSNSGENRRNYLPIAEKACGGVWSAFQDEQAKLHDAEVKAEAAAAAEKAKRALVEAERKQKEHVGAEHGKEAQLKADQEKKAMAEALADAVANHWLPGKEMEQAAKLKAHTVEAVVTKSAPKASSAAAVAKTEEKRQEPAKLAKDDIKNVVTRPSSKAAGQKAVQTADKAATGTAFLQFSAPSDELAREMTHDLELNFNKIAPFGKEDTAKELQDHASKTQDTLVDAVENAEVAEIKRAVFRALTRLRAATIKEFDTIARLETQAIDAYNDAHHFRAENPLAHLHEDEAPVETDKLKSFH